MIKHTTPFLGTRERGFFVWGIGKPDRWLKKQDLTSKSQNKSQSVTYL